MAESGNDAENPCISSFFVESLEVGSSATALVSEQPLLESTIASQMAPQQEYNATDTNCTEAVTSFQDGQEVELDDGSTAYIFHQPKDNYPAELIQPVQVNGVMTAYIYRPNQENLSGEVQPGTSDDEEPLRIPIQTQTNVEIKEIKSRPPQTFQCDRANCKKFYSSAHHLKVHKRSHTGEKPYVCRWENCKKVFTTSYALKSHHRVHTGEKPYRCPLPPCKKAFKTSGDLHKHIRTHTGEKPFKCPFEGCGKAFTTSNICKIHIRTHTGERPHKCPFTDCPKSFANITNYKNHVRIHTGEKPYVCTVGNCGKQFTEYSSLYKHQIVHSVDKPYSCPYCDKVYRQVSTLMLHKKKSHKEMEDKDLSAINAKHSTISTYNANFLNSKLHTNQTNNSNKSDSTKTSSVVVVPVKAMTSSCIVMNSQFSGLPTQESESQLKFVTGNENPEPVMVSVEPDGSDISNTRLEFQPSVQKSDEETLYINKELTPKSDQATESYSSMVLPSAVVAAETNQEPCNTAASELWMKMNFPDPSLNPETAKQTDQQFQVATLEINGTKYLVQVFDDSASEGNIPLASSVNASNILTACQGTNLTDSSAAVSGCTVSSSDHNSYFVSADQVPVEGLVPQTVLVGNSANETSLISQDGLQILQMPVTKSHQVTQLQVQQTKKLANSNEATKLVPILPASKQRITVKLPRKIRPALHKTQPTTLKRIVPKLKPKSP